MTMLKPAGHAPSVLEVITDLSNDEVFTPPKVANAVLDLLPDNVWTDPTLRWVDIGAKTGVFLREITRRLMNGLADAIPDEGERLDHILRNMVHGIAITELTSLMSRRTLYCSKKADSEHSAVKMPTPTGNVWFERVEHSYKNGRCTECSASQELMERDNRENHAYAFIHANGRKAVEKEIGMKFDVIVGNPPYQMTGGGGGTNDTPLYNLFVEQAKALNPRYIAMIIPSRWMAGGRGLDDFRAGMLKDKRIRHLIDYPNAWELFPGVEIQSGICYFLWDSTSKGSCSVTLVRGDKKVGPTERNLEEFDVFVRDEQAVKIARKVMAHEESTVADLVSGDTPFGLASNFKEYRKGAKKPGDLKLYIIEQQKRTEKWVATTAVSKNVALIDAWKVLVPKAYNGGPNLPHRVIGPSFVAEPMSVCSQSYLVVGPFKTKEEAESFQSYIDTRFFRLLLSLRKISQDAMKSTYAWVPQQLWDRTWTDAELYEKYGISAEEQAYIAETVRELTP
jgi:site-specific DNA-methyltransferase (adenine-specific)